MMVRISVGPQRYAGSTDLDMMTDCHCWTCWKLKRDNASVISPSSVTERGAASRQNRRSLSRMGSPSETMDPPGALQECSPNQPSRASSAKGVKPREVSKKKSVVLEEGADLRAQTCGRPGQRSLSSCDNGLPQSAPAVSKAFVTPEANLLDESFFTPQGSASLATPASRLLSGASDKMSRRAVSTTPQVQTLFLSCMPLQVVSKHIYRELK